MPQTVPAQGAVGADDVHAPDREPSQLHAEHENEDEAEPEGRDRVPADREDADGVIDETAAPQCRNDAEWDADGNGDEKGADRDLQAVRDALADHLDDRAVVVEGVPEVELNDVPEPGDELEGQRVVQTK